MPLATPDKILPTAGTRLEVGTSVEHKVLEHGRKLQAANKDNWRSRLIEQPRNLEDLKGQTERVENDFSINHIPYKDGTPEKNKAEDRSTRLKKIDTALTDLQRGFNNLETGEKTAVLDSLTPIFVRTARWQEIVNNTPAGQHPPSEADAKLFLSEMLTKGEIDPVSLHKEFKEAITSSQQDIKATYAQIDLKKQEFQQLAEIDKALEEQQQEIVDRNNKIQDELNKFKSGNDYDKIIQAYEDDKNNIDDAIEKLPNEIDTLKDDIRELKRQQAAEEKRSGYVDIGKIVAKTATALPGVGTTVGPAVNAAVEEVESATFTRGEKIAQEIADKKQELRNKEGEKNTANNKKSQCERKKALKIEKEEEQKKEKATYKSLAEKRKALEEQAKLIHAEVTRSEESFAGLEERVIDRMNGVAENALIRANNASMEREAINLEAGLAAISHEHRTMVRNAVTKKCITEQKEHWYSREKKRKYDTNEIDGLWEKIVNETDANHTAVDSMDAFLTTSIDASEINWANCTPEEKQQMRALLTEEGIRMRFEATDKTPTALEQRILMTQSWNEELVKAAVLKKPEFAEKLASEAGVSVKDITSGNPDALDKATEKIGSSRLLFLLMIGLTALQAGSQIGKEEQPSK
jgi:hypothetical protein